jgi:hypothetical protein
VLILHGCSLVVAVHWQNTNGSLHRTLRYLLDRLAKNKEKISNLHKPLKVLVLPTILYVTNYLPKAQVLPQKPAALPTQLKHLSSAPSVQKNFPSSIFSSTYLQNPSHAIKIGNIFHSRHTKKHSRPFKCQVNGCHQAFQFSKDLGRHVKSVHQQITNSEPLYCPFEGCKHSLGVGKGIMRKDNLDRHIRTAHGK